MIHRIFAISAIATSLFAMDQQLMTNTTKQPVALGCLKFSFININDEAIASLIQKALDTNEGDVYLDTAAAYGHDQDNEKKVGRVLTHFTPEDQKRIKVITKCGIQFNPDKPFLLEEKDIRESCKRSTELLGRKPDLFLVHRLPKKINEKEIQPIVHVLRSLKESGQIESFGFSELTKEQLELVLQQTSIDALEIAYGPFTLRAETNGVKELCEKNNIKIFAYGVSLRGLLRETLLTIEDENPEKIIADLKKVGISDFTLNVGFLQPEYVVQNIKLIKQFISNALAHKQSPNAQAIAFVLNKNIIPIIETSNMEHLKDNLNAYSERYPTTNISPDGYNLLGDPNPLILGYLDPYI